MRAIKGILAGSVLALVLSGVAFASTGLHQTPPLAAADYKGGAECDGVVVPDGKVLWHFVLTQTEATEAMLTVTFGYPVYDSAWLSSKNSGGVLHWNVLSDSGQVVVNAVSTADGALLNLSHTCYTEAQPSSPPSSDPSVEPSPSSAPSSTPTPSPSSTPSATPSDSPSATPIPSDTPSTSTAPTPPTPRLTAPPTDTAATSDAIPDHSTRDRAAIIAAIVGVIAGAQLLRPAKRRRR